MILQKQFYQFFEPDDPDYLYRVWAGSLFSDVDDNGQPLDYVPFHIIPFQIERRTAKGAWIKDEYYRNRFVLAGEGKRYAHERKRWALYSFQRRAMTHQYYAKRAVDKAAVTIPQAERLMHAMKEHGL